MITGELVKEKSEKEYRLVDLLSASDLRLFNTDRKKFWKEKVLGEKREEEYNKSILLGSVAHCLLLDPHKFDEKYIMSTCETPPTGMVLTFTESLYRQTIGAMDEEGRIGMDFKEMLDVAYAESGFKITLEAAVKKFNETGKEYYEQLVKAKAQGLEIVCMNDINIANRIVEIIRGDKFVGGYFNNVDFCELQVEGFEVDGVKMKAMMDKLLVSHEHEVIRLVDLKIVFDNQNFMREYYLKKQAYIQGYIYYQALKSGKLELGFDYSKYLIMAPTFLAADSGCFYAPVSYEMTHVDLRKAYEGFEYNGRAYRGVKETLEELNWSMETGIWNMSKKAYDNRGILNLE